ncbi:FMP21-like protein [Saccharomyces kudriavzevii IFO 1802]|nr:YBR269C-like protein [Saccharomyces cerevisiae x Saccharomyces kudriavzevii VIN7]EJT43013.1 FMP21-like protein [Saccharomyces kudriavzevii IFO 1802]
MQALPLFRGGPSYIVVRNITTERIPSPPKLPREEQEEFERLQRVATSQEAIDQYNARATGDPTKESLNSPFLTKNDIGSFSPEFSKTIPEFEGDVNPKTGEIGGPKQDPLRHGDYSFNGRVTDF